VISLVRYHDFVGQAWAEGKGSLHHAAIRRLRRRNGLYIWAMPLVMIYLGPIRVLNKKKKKKKKPASHRGTLFYLYSSVPNRPLSHPVPEEKTS